MASRPSRSNSGTRAAPRCKARGGGGAQLGNSNEVTRWAAVLRIAELMSNIAGDTMEAMRNGDWLTQERERLEVQLVRVYRDD